MSIKFFLHSETQKRKVLHENIPTPKRSQESDSTCKGTKISCIWNGLFVKQIALLVWIHFRLTCRQYEAFQKPRKKRKQSTCFYHAPTAVETAENMAALNVEYIAWIITVLGTINSNHTFIFDLNCFLWKLKASKRQVVSFLLETKHKVFRFKTKPIPRMSVQDAKNDLKILVVNAQLSVALTTGSL